jgi:hypothetical protein
MDPASILVPIADYPNRFISSYYEYKHGKRRPRSCQICRNRKLLCSGPTRTDRQCDRCRNGGAVCLYVLTDTEKAKVEKMNDEVGLEMALESIGIKNDGGNLVDTSDADSKPSRSVTPLEKAKAGDWDLELAIALLNPMHFVSPRLEEARCFFSYEPASIDLIDKPMPPLDIIFCSSEYYFDSVMSIQPHINRSLLNRLWSVEPMILIALSFMVLTTIGTLGTYSEKYPNLAALTRQQREVYSDAMQRRLDAFVVVCQEREAQGKTLPWFTVSIFNFLIVGYTFNGGREVSKIDKMVALSIYSFGQDDNHWRYYRGGEQGVFTNAHWMEL